MKPRKHLTFILFVCLFTISSVYAQSQGDIVDRLDKALGVSLPGDYQQKVKTFVQTNTVLKDQGTADFTENFIKEEMSKDWSIEKHNQLLFIWHAIYKQITADDLYKGDGDSKIAEDFNSRTVNVRIRACGQKYQNQVVAYMNQRSDEAKQRSAEAQQRSAEAKQRSDETVKEIMSQDTVWVREQMPEFYDLYQKNPTNIKQVDLIFMKESSMGFIDDCKKRGIDYRAILLKELGDQKKVDDLLKFYGVE